MNKAVEYRCIYEWRKKPCGLLYSLSSHEGFLGEQSNKYMHAPCVTPLLSFFTVSSFLIDDCSHLFLDLLKVDKMLKRKALKILFLYLENVNALDCIIPKDNERLDEANCSTYPGLLGLTPSLLLPWWLSSAQRWRSALRRSRAGMTLILQLTHHICEY